MHFVLIHLAVSLCVFTRHIAVFKGVFAAPYTDVGVHAAHTVGVVIRPALAMLFARAHEQSPVHPLAAYFHKRITARFVNGFDYFFHKSVVNAGDLDKDVFARLDRAAVIYQIFRQNSHSAVFHLTHLL